MENKNTTIPAIGDWIPVDHAGHTGIVIALLKGEIHRDNYAIVGVFRRETEDIELPYFTRYSEATVKSISGVSTDLILEDANYYGVLVDNLRLPASRFTTGMHIKVGFNDNDLAEVVSITRNTDGEIEFVTVSMLSGRMTPGLCWGAKKRMELLDIPYSLLCLWEDSILPDTTSDFIAASTSLNGYQRIVPECSALMAHAALYNSVKYVKELVSAGLGSINEHHLGAVLYHLTQLASACGYDLQDIATQSLADNN